MSNVYRTVTFFILITFMTACTTPVTVVPTLSALPEPKIDRYPEPLGFRGPYPDLTLPKFDPNSTDSMQIDLRSRDLTAIDMSASLADLMYADFDSKTQWPPTDKIPAAFDWQKIMETGKDPGLGIRALHEQRITGKGIGIAIIDQTLLVDHIEYKDRLRVYEEAEDINGDWHQARLHGPAVASIAVGRTIGVAPEADLYYIATGACDGFIDIKDFDFSCYAKATQRIVEINKSLPADRKIRVLSMSIGWSPRNKGYDKIMAAVKEAKDAGIFVIHSGLLRTDKLRFHGLGRNPLDDPNLFESYAPGLWWEQDFFAGQPSAQHSGLPADFYSRASIKQMLLVPMDSRTTASPTGTEDYVFYREGGWSWSIPYLAGMYALAAQVQPEITPEEFWATALKTGRTIQIQHDGKDYEFGVILDPQALIDALKSK